MCQTYQGVHSIKKQACQSIQRQPNFLYYADNDNILDEIIIRDNIEDEIQINNRDNSQYFTHKNIHIITFYMVVEPYVNVYILS